MERGLSLPLSVLLAAAALVGVGCSEPQLTQATGPSSDAGVPGSESDADSRWNFTPSDGGTDGAVSSGDNCGLKKYRLLRGTPEILLVLDRSNSMNQNVPATMNTRWTEVTAAIEDVLQKTDATVQWGLKTFPTVEGCEVVPNPEVPIAPMNYGPLSAFINLPSTKPKIGGTPTDIAIQAAHAYLDGRKSNNPKYIVLATDGEPGCGTGSSVQATVDALAAAAKAGYHTFVIGIAISGMADSALAMMARAGGEARPGAPAYYPVVNRQDLTASLGLITGQVVNCMFALDMTPPSPDDVAVKADGVRINRDPARQDGWDYDTGGKSIQLYGPACEKLKAGGIDNVEITFGCPGVLIP